MWYVPNQKGNFFFYFSNFVTGYYKNIADPGDPALYQVSSDLCTQNYYTLCQMSYCSPITTAPNPEFLWIEWKLHCFYLNPTPMSYYDAETWCESNAGVLATPDLSEENDFMLRIFPNTARSVQLAFFSDKTKLFFFVFQQKTLDWN